MKFKYLKTFALIKVNIILAQPLPYMTFDYHKQKYKSYTDWSTYSNFKTFLNFSTTKNFGFISEQRSTKNTSYNFSAFYKILTKNNFYLYLNPQITYELKSNKTQKGKIFLNNNLSGIGFKNKWVNLQIGRGTESWSAGIYNQLLLSEYSSPYDYFKLFSDYGSLKVNYIHGILEKLDNQLNRYINAKSIEWTNKKSIVIGLSETVIYSGMNRQIELTYVNPISSHLESELNDRLTINGSSNSNAVWQLHLNIKPKEGFRLSANFLVDELVLDKDIQIKKEHGTGFSAEFSFSTAIKDEKFFIYYASFEKIGTPTFRHSSGMNNFISDSKPIGWQFGSDGDEFSLGFSCIYKNIFVFNTSIGYVRLGEESILYRPYDTYNDYLIGSFPSGKSTKFFDFNAELLLNVNRYSTLFICVNQHTSYIPKNDFYPNFRIGLIFNSMK
tara:strand:- start:711 stop:2036 length:1326 start_codon:yes stop_codon:yes gene_type:complete